MSDSWQLMQKMPFAAAEAGGAEGLVAGQDGEVLDLVAAGAAAVGAVVADEGAVAEEEQVGVGVEEGVALVAAEAVEMPSVVCCGRGDTARPHSLGSMRESSGAMAFTRHSSPSQPVEYEGKQQRNDIHQTHLPLTVQAVNGTNKKLTKFKSLPLFQNLPQHPSQHTPSQPSQSPIQSPATRRQSNKLTSPHPLHGYASSSPAESGYSPAATAASGASMAQAASLSPAQSWW
ncbi:hypothetical protein V501_04804 [Pseudogymnoascus sp. VKM F-4519 (FW-2642)]|nr:hypothetical protein V501_04804 [Pseudogymnoascus sp. VKM F-4519 (FW-2642)]